jgi:RND family efflux transporter MFP subunit
VGSVPKLAPETQQARRERILDAAERCFIEKGFHPATMADICREAGVSPGALYIYFTSKEDLIAGLCEREKDRFTNELARITGTVDILAALQSLAEQYCCNEPIEKVRLHMEIAAEAGRNETIGRTVREMDRIVCEGLTALLEREKERGRIAPELPADTIVRAMGALGDGLFLRRAADPHFDPRPIIPVMMTMISALLAPRPPSKPSPERKRSKIRRLAVWMGFLFAASLQVTASFAGEDAVKDRPAAAGKAKPPAVTVVEARRITFVDGVLVTGSLVPREEVLAGPEIDGYRITGLLTEEGDRVEAGQVLARLSREILEVQLAQNAASIARSQAAADQVRNQIAESEATLRQNEDAFNRVKPLRESGVASQATFDERDTAFRTARARLAAQKDGLKLAEADLLLMKAQRQELELKLARTEIRAPAAGIISRRTARLGSISYSSSDALFRIVKDGEIELDAEVPEFYMAKLRKGQRAQVEIAGSGERSGTVRLVSPEVNPSSRLGKVRIFLGYAPGLRIGTFAKAMIDAGQRDSVGVPSTAVLYHNDSAIVLLVADNKVRERVVKPGLLAGDSVEIKEGLKEGELVVLRAGSLLRNGDIIDPQLGEQRTAARVSEAGIGK